MYISTSTNIADGHVNKLTVENNGGASPLLVFEGNDYTNAGNFNLTADPTGSFIDIFDTHGEFFYQTSDNSYLCTTGTFGLRTGSGTFDAVLSTVPLSASRTFTFPNWTGNFLVASTTSLYQTVGGQIGIGTSTPTATFQATASADNATTSIQFGKAGQNKGTCVTYYDTAGSPVYGFIAAGATTFTYTATKPSGCQN